MQWYQQLTARYDVQAALTPLTVAGRRRQGEQVIQHAAMLVQLLQQGHSKLTMVAAPDIGWKASSARFFSPHLLSSHFTLALPPSTW